VVPIGISFYTFHHISYVVDIYRGERQALRNPVSFAAYIAMFPQLVAGPIVRYREIADQLPQQRSHRLDDIAAGFPRFALGLCKKTIIADSLSPLVEACFKVPPDEMTFATAWLGAIGYTLQLFFDFSGYSDMAIGLGRMLGFRLPENFATPYSSVTITEFWRRWHMSLSRWFRDYVYIPLGGNRNGAAKFGDRLQAGAGSVLTGGGQQRPKPLLDPSMMDGKVAALLVVAAAVVTLACGLLTAVRIRRAAPPPSMTVSMLRRTVVPAVALGGVLAVVMPVMVLAAEASGGVGLSMFGFSMTAVRLQMSGGLWQAALGGLLGGAAAGLLGALLVEAGSRLRRRVAP
jgi:hypothetical protein